MENCNFIKLSVFICLILVFIFPQKSYSFGGSHSYIPNPSSKRQAQVQFINNSSTRKIGVIVLESVAVGLVYANLTKNYQKTYWVTGKNAKKSTLINSLSAAVNNYPVVDVFISAHGQGGPVYNQVDGFQGMDFVADDDIRNWGNGNSRSKNLRMVYQMICYGWYTGDAWLTAGADGVIGADHVTVNAPLEFPSFTKSWGKPGKTLSQVRDSSWFVSGWIDSLYSTWGGKKVDSYKHLKGSGSVRNY